VLNTVTQTRKHLTMYSQAYPDRHCAILYTRHTTTSNETIVLLAAVGLVYPKPVSREYEHIMLSMQVNYRIAFCSDWVITKKVSWSTC